MGLEQNNEQHYREVVDKYHDPFADYQMTTRDYVLRPYTVGEAITITLPNVVEAKGRFYSIVARAITAAFYITIQDGDDSDRWEGDLTLNVAGQAILLYSDGIKWMGRTFNKIVVDGYSHNAITVGPAETGVSLNGAMTTGISFEGAITNNILMGNVVAGSSILATTAGAEPTGGFIKCGTAGARIVQDVVDMKFMSFYFDNGALSGDNRGMYLRQYITGVGGGGDALRVFSTVEDVAAATVHGAHISLNFGDTGTVTGQGIACRNTLHLPDVALVSNVTMAAVEAEIWSDGSSSDPGGSTLLSCFLVNNGGDATGMEDVDTDAVLFDFRGWVPASGSMLYDSTGAVPGNSDGSIKIRLPSGALAYLLYFDAQAA